MQDKKRDIVNAAIECVADNGLVRTTTAAIAKHAGVGEGTLYRYFANKDELLESAAYSAGTMISEELLKNYDETASVYTQYVRFCTDVIRSGMKNSSPHRFLEQFRDSPQGIIFKKKKLKEMINDPKSRPFLYPLNAILHRAREQEVMKDLPLQVLGALTIGPLIFVLKDGLHGVFELNDEIISGVAKACWDSVRR